MNETQNITVEVPASVEPAESKKNKGKTKIIAAVSAVVAVALIAVVAVLLLVPAAATKEVAAQIDAMEAIKEENYYEALNVLAAYNDLSALEKRKIKNYAALDEKFQAYFKSIMNEIDANCTEMTRDSYDNLLSCQATYNNLSDEHKAYITNFALLKESLDAAKAEKMNGIVSDILASKDAEYILSTTNEYKDDLTKDQYLKCLLNYAQWASFNVAENTLIEKLKDPYSYQRISGSVRQSTIAEDKRSGSYYVEIEYSATNSFGGRLKDTYIDIINFTISKTGKVSFESTLSILY